MLQHIYVIIWFSYNEPVKTVFNVCAPTVY